MAITCTWSIDEMFSYPEVDGKSDVVFGVAYTINGDNGSHVASQSAQIPMPLPEGDFTPYADLTEDQVVGWVKSQLGADAVAALEAQIAQMIAEQESPSVVVNPLPWAN